jgi:1-acyl-sn-glycerol-3-phosphate acyltransferase
MRLTMASYEGEFKRFEPFVQKASAIALLGKKLLVRGQENFIRGGPSIIVGNHCGSYKDVAIVCKIVPRPFFFTANREIFTRSEFSHLVRKHLRRHLKNFGLLLNFFLNPYKFLFVQYFSSNIAKVGTIPVDLGDHGKREAIERCQDYLKQGRRIIALQGYGRVVPKDPNPYVKGFGRGVSIISYNMYEQEKIVVPVTPMAIYGTQRLFLVPGKVLVNVGQPMVITEYLVGGFEETVERFKNALEAAVNKLFLDLIRT